MSDASEIANHGGGPLLLGTYAHVRELGRGATGRVVLVRDVRATGAVADACFAAKIVPAAYGRRLLWERDLLVRVRHPRLCEVRDLFEVAAALGPPFRLEVGDVVLLETWVEGRASESALTGLGDVERVAAAMRLGADVARALAALHEAGIIHGDVKPGNVVVAGDLEAATLVDLGLAGAPGERTALEGTPAYLAPEAVVGQRSVATDLYALGATIFDWLDGGAALLGGASQLGGDAASRTPSEPRRDGVALAAPARRAFPAFAPEPLRALVGELLASSALERPGSAREVVRRLLALEGAALSTETLLDAPSAADRALAASAIPLVGRDAELRGLTLALQAPGVVRLDGPSGAGKTRLFREAARARQAACAARGTPIPRVHEALDLEGDALGDAIVLVVAELDEADAWARVRAAELAGQRLLVVLERARGAEPGTRRIVLGPLARPDVASLLALLTPDAPVRAGAIDLELRASAGQPGRLVRAFVLAWTRGEDPTQAGVLERSSGERSSGEREGKGGPSWPAELGAVRRALAISGGSLEARLAVAAGVELAATRRLTALGLVGFDGERISMRAEDVRAARAEPETRADRALAERIARAATRGEERAYAWLLLDPARGEAESLRAMLDLRGRGDVAAAVELGRTALAELPGALLSLVLETIDALRAAGDLPGGLALARGRAEPEVALAAAELERLSHRYDAADALARTVHGARALAVRARARLDLSDPRAAEALAGEALASAGGDVVARARALETLALAADDAEARAGHARALEGLLGEIDSDVALATHVRLGARMRVLSVLAALAASAGRTGEAATLHSQSAALARDLGERVAAARFAANVGIASLDLGRLGPAQDALTDAARRMTLARDDERLGRVLYNLANATFCAGDVGRADLLARRAIEVAALGGDHAARALASVVRADVELAGGRPVAARTELEHALTLGPAASEEVVLEARLSIVLSALGRHADARAIAARALARERAGPVAALEARVAAGRVELTLGAIEVAYAHAVAAASLARDVGAYEARARSLLLLADVLGAAGRAPEARATLAELGRLYDDALRSLPPAAQQRMRALPVHKRALGVLPATPLPRDAADPADGGARVVRAAAAIVREARPRRVLEALATAALELSAAERAFVVERTGGGALVVRSARGGAGPLPKVERPSMSVASRALDRREVVRSTDALVEVALSDAASVHAMALRSVLAVPIPGAGAGVERALVLDDRLRPGAFDERVTEALMGIADIAGIAVAHAEAVRDGRLDLVRSRRRERALSRRLEAGDEARATGGQVPAIVARSTAMRAALEVVSRAAPSALPVLLLGESGTGKELLARTLAARSGSAGPFVVASASALPDTLLESALFGHVRGAFTGADRPQRGLFELADGGTLFLDEIGAATPALQSKLLRVLESGELRPVGATRARHVSVRLVCATRHDLDALVRAGSFREDLFWRIAVVTVRVPPLRERPEDVAPLVRALLERHADGSAPRVAPGALAALGAYSWPGNVRELENELQRALLILADGKGPLGLEHLSSAVRGEDREPETLELGPHVEALERRLVRRALERCGNNQTHAARALGVSRFGLSKMIARLGLGRGA